MFITSIYFVHKNAGITMIFKLLLPANSATVSVKYFAKTNKSDPKSIFDNWKKICFDETKKMPEINLNIDLPFSDILKN